MKKIFGFIVLTLLLVSFFLGPICSAYTPHTRGTDDSITEFNTWKELETVESPGVRICSLMVYDSESDKVILFGGFNGAKMSGETWVYDYATNTWTNKTMANSPPGRCGYGLIYDAGRDKCIIFGGIGDNSKYFNDTWEYDYNTNTWTELKPEVSPSPRCKGGIAYDSESDQIVWFGGYGPNKVLLAETWTYNYDKNTWVNKTSSASPTGRQRIPLMYDSESDRVILFGGWLGDENVLGDTWAYDFNTNTWTDMKPALSPHPRARYGRAYIPESDVIIYTHGYGGADGDLNDTWTYDHNNNKWTQVEIQNTPPISRHCFQIALNTKDDVIIFQGGAGTTQSYTDTWALAAEEPTEEDDKEDDEEGFLPGFEAMFIVIGIVIVMVGFRRKSLHW